MAEERSCVAPRREPLNVIRHLPMAGPYKIEGGQGFLRLEQKPTRAETLYVRAAAVGQDGIRPLINGSTSRKGAAFLALFPFDILTRPGLNEIVCRIDHREIVIYPPFPNGNRVGLEFEQVRKDLVPARPGAVPPGRKAPALKSFELSQSGYVYADALRMDMSPDPEPDAARALMERLIGLIRWHTKQWWIGHDRRHTVSFLRNWFPINELGERLAGFQSFGTLFGHFGFETLLSQDLIERACQDLYTDRSLPLAWEMLLDGCFSTALRRHERALIELATAAEVAMASAVATHQGEKRAKRFDRLNFEERLDGGAATYLGRSFCGDEPLAADCLVRLWIARGHVAHGKPAVIVEQGHPRPLSRQDVLAMIDATFALLN